MSSLELEINITFVILNTSSYIRPYIYKSRILCRKIYATQTKNKNIWNEKKKRQSNKRAYYIRI